LKSCPTGAIYEPYKVKRDLCITEWLWGTFIPIQLRDKQENRIFGCGECIKACPKNKKLKPRQEYPVKIDDVGTTPELIPLVTGDKQYFKKNIASFPMCAGMDAIRGNAIIALGNMGPDAEKAINPICETLTHSKSQIRSYSAWALGRIGGIRAKEALENASKNEENPDVKEEIHRALG